MGEGWEWMGFGVFSQTFSAFYVVKEFFFCLQCICYFKLTFIFAFVKFAQDENKRETNYTWTGLVVNLLAPNGSKPRRPISAWNSTYVQDRPSQVWEYCSQLDPEVRHGLTYGARKISWRTDFKYYLMAYSVNYVIQKTCVPFQLLVILLSRAYLLIS